MTQAMANPELKQFRFRIIQKPVPGQQRVEADLELRMTQEQFEDHQIRRAMVKTGISQMGLDVNATIYYQNPPYTEDELNKLRDAFGGDESHQLSARYAHSGHFVNYHLAVVDGKAYRYMGFGGGHIKFAPEL